METTSELYEILALDIPEGEKAEDGFLDIIGKAYDENINSRIYAYFMDQNKNPELASLFLESLLNLTGSSLEMYDFTSQCEVGTNKGRIDIVLEDVESESVVLIENKIYHHDGGNPFDDYWNHYSYSDKNKLGILLTLKKNEIKERHGNFINITHKEWIDAVRNNGLPAGLNSKLYSYLNDFFQTIDNLTTSTEMNEQAKFYFKHTKQLNLAKEAYDEANKYVVDQMNQLAGEFDWVTYGQSYGWRNLWDKEHDCRIYYTVDYTGLIEGTKEIQLILEISREKKENIEELRALVADIPEFKEMKPGWSNKTIMHFGVRSYTLTEEQIADLKGTLHELLKKDFEPVMQMLLKKYYPEKYK